MGNATGAGALVTGAGGIFFAGAGAAAFAVGSTYRDTAGLGSRWDAPPWVKTAMSFAEEGGEEGAEETLTDCEVSCGNAGVRRL